MKKHHRFALCLVIGTIAAAPAWIGQGHAEIILPPYVKGAKTCAKNVDRAIAANGRRPLKTARARDFLSLPRVKGKPQPLDVRVCARGKRGGHVQIMGKSGWINPSVRKQAWDRLARPCRALIAVVRP